MRKCFDEGWLVASILTFLFNFISCGDLDGNLQSRKTFPGSSQLENLCKFMKIVNKSSERTKRVKPLWKWGCLMIYQVWGIKEDEEKRAECDWLVYGPRRLIINISALTQFMNITASHPKTLTIYPNQQQRRFQPN